MLGAYHRHGGMHFPSRQVIQSRGHTPSVASQCSSGGGSVGISLDGSIVGSSVGISVVGSVVGFTVDGLKVTGSCTSEATMFTFTLML